MKITADRPALADALTWAAQTLARNPQQPVLAAIRLTLGDGTLTAESTDWEAWTSSVTPCTVHDGEPGEMVALAGARLAAIVAALAGAEVVIEQAEPGGPVTVSAGKRSRYTLAPLADVHDWPKPPELGPLAATVADAADLADAFARVAVAVDPDSARQNLRGVGLRVDYDAEAIDLLGTDARRIAGMSIGADVSASAELNVHARRVGQVLKGLHGALRVHATPGDDGVLALVTGARTAIMRTTAGQGPAGLRESLTRPELEPVVVTVHAAATIEAVKRALLSAGWTGGGDRNAQKSRHVLLEVADGLLSITSTDDGSSGDEQVDADHDGDVTATFNAEYLLDGLAAARGTKITLTIPASGLRAASIVSDAEDGYRYVTMPIRV